MLIGNKSLKPISCIYRALEDIRQTHYIKLKGEKELKVVISDKNWTEIQVETH